MRVTILYLQPERQTARRNSCCRHLLMESGVPPSADRLAQIAGRHENWETGCDGIERIWRSLRRRPASADGVSPTAKKVPIQSARIEVARSKMPTPKVPCLWRISRTQRDGGALLESMEMQKAHWLRFLRRRERQSGVVLKTLFFRTKELSGTVGGKRC